MEPFITAALFIKAHLASCTGCHAWVAYHLFPGFRGKFGFGRAA